MVLARDIKGMPREQITRTLKVPFRLRPHQEEGQAGKLQAWMFLLPYFPLLLGVASVLGVTYAYNSNTANGRH